MTRKENTFAIQPLPETFLLWEWTFPTGPLQKTWSSPSEPTDPRHVASFVSSLPQIQFWDFAQHLTQLVPRESFAGLAKKSWTTNQCCFVPFLITIYLKSKIRGSVFMWMSWLLASSSARNEYLTFALSPLCRLEMPYRSAVQLCFSISKELRQSNNKKSPNLGELSH